jgi:hypothetical protein
MISKSDFQTYPCIRVIVCSGEKTGSTSLYYCFLPYNGKYIDDILKNQKEKTFIILSYRTPIERIISAFFPFKNQKKRCTNDVRRTHGLF